MPTGTNTIFFIPHNKKPTHKKATYVRIVCADRPQKEDKKIVRWTTGGDLVQYDGDLATSTVNIITVKYHVNSTISDTDFK